MGLGRPGRDRHAGERRSLDEVAEIEKDRVRILAAALGEPRGGTGQAAGKWIARERIHGGDATVKIGREEDRAARCGHESRSLPRVLRFVTRSIRSRIAPVMASFVVANEDTLGPPPVTTLDTIEVTTERLGIAEIVDRCVRHEEEVRAQLMAHDWTQWVKTSLAIGENPEQPDKEIVIEEVARVELRRESAPKSVLLARHEYELRDGERKERDVKAVDHEGNGVTIGYEDFDDLPFYLEDRDDYEFRIQGRQIVGARLIYEVHLEPKSDFAVAPRGRIWVDTSTFQILREEFDFGDRVPLPMFVKAIGPVVREREQLGDVWVLSRMLVRVDLRVGWLRFMDDEIPERVEITVAFRDHVLEQAK